MVLKITLISFLVLSSCAGVKVINPEDAKHANGKYTCSLVASNGKRVYASGSNEADARDEAIARCRDKTLISACSAKNTKCVKNY